MTVDYANKIVLMDASITDIPVFHEALRDAESTETGMLYPTIHTYKQVDLGGGSIFPAVDFINGWTLQFPVGNYTIAGGNLNATINPIAGCYVKQTQSAAYAVTATGGSGFTLDQIADAVWTRTQRELTAASTSSLTQEQNDKLMESLSVGEFIALS